MLASAAPAAKTGGDYFTAEHVAAIRARAKQPEYARTLEQTIACQSALKTDPPSASNIDPPLWVILALCFWSLSSSYRCLFL